MAVQTYCTRTEIEDILGIPGVLACLDDDESGIEESSPESAYLTSCIERGAIEINGQITYQYTLASVASNDWLKWCNAYLAAYYLKTRRGNTCDEGIVDQVVEYRKLLNEIRWGRFSLAGQLPSFSGAPSVSTFKPELMKVSNPIRVVEEESTGGTPGPGISRNNANVPGNL